MRLAAHRTDSYPVVEFWFIWSDKLGLPAYPPVHITLYDWAHVIGNWEIAHVSEPQRFVLYAHAYLNSALLSCEQMAAHQAQRTWPNATVVLMLSAHSVELFLKGAILSRDNNAKVGDHRIDLLTEKYRELYVEPCFEFDVPFRTEYPSISEEEIQALKKTEPVPSILFRYPVRKPGVEWQGVHGFEADGFLRILANLGSSYERISIVI